MTYVAPGLYLLWTVVVGQPQGQQALLLVQ